MRAIGFCLTLLLACVTVRAQTANDGMTNGDVIRLVKAGLGEDAIIAKIAESGPKGAFDTSIDGLIKLKEAGVSDAIVRAMIARPATPPAGGPAAEGIPETGLFAEREGSLVRLEPTTSRVKGGMRSITHSLPGSSAKVGLAGARPRFVFSFANAVGALAMSGPGEFVLLRLAQTGEGREVKVKWGGASGRGLRFGYKDLGARKYEVSPDDPLAPGEYAFYHEAAGRFFDFKVVAGGAATAKR